MVRTPLNRSWNRPHSGLLQLLGGSFLEDVLSSLFPRICPLCQGRLTRPGDGFCAPCASSFQLLLPPFCSRCGEPLPGKDDLSAGRCETCLRTFSPTALRSVTVRSAALYTGTLRRAILEVKYHGRIALSLSLGLFVKSQYPRLFDVERFDCILPVPLHVRRLRQRGFNQCVLLAAPLARSLRIPLDRGSIRKIRETAPQSLASGMQRRKNLHNTFSVMEPLRVAGRSVLVLDDVYTTGTTIETLAGVLFSAGARKVAALTLGRSMRTPACEQPPD
jgi:ComF family protein